MMALTMDDYLGKIVGALTRISEEERAGLDAASDLVADVIARDGLIFVFGCGHSHLPALDAFYRAGGLANVSPILDDDLMLHVGAANAIFNLMDPTATGGAVPIAKVREFMKQQGN